MISFDASVCSVPEAALQRESLETNGLGGFASSTIAGINTRRYHGLLTAALQPPVGRYVLLSKLEETLVAGGERFDLSANLYPSTIFPAGFQYLAGFRLDPFPIFTWRVAGLEIEKRIFMAHGENTTVVEYELRGPGVETAALELRPLIAFREYHSLTHRNDVLNGAIAEETGVVSIAPYPDLPRLWFAHDAVSVEQTGQWYFNFEYPEEKERGLDYREDLFQPFVLRCGSSAVVIVSTERHARGDLESLRIDELARRSALPDTPLSAAADQFIVRRAGDLHTVIAGYHWFSDWGRDTMISLPGLTLATGRVEIARDILRAFSDAASEGMLPNRFPDSGETPEYNTVDASLWYFETIRRFLETTGDVAFVRDRLYSTMVSIIDWHLKGTRYGIRCDIDGLIAAGDNQTQLTWMDARVDGAAMTPRSGKPVEIQALWFNALRVTQALASQMGDTNWVERLENLAVRGQASFLRLFPNQVTGCLYDCVDGESRDGSIRPNQLIALSLGYPIVTDAALARGILRVVARDLLTPYGLRTLAPSDPKYRPRCTGTAKDRDSAYHQGTVWPWLLGPYDNACRRFDLPPPSLERLYEHLRTAGLTSISEIFDGAEPFQPRGCIAQAWSVAEILRIGSAGPPIAK